jgi:hypothetical protein
MDIITDTPVVITGQFRDNGRFYLSSSIDFNMRATTAATVEVDTHYGIYSSEKAAQRVIDRTIKAQERTGDIDWTDFRIEAA